MMETENQAPHYSPHPDYSTFTNAQLEGEQEEVAEKIRLAKEYSDDLTLVSWFETEMNLLQAERARRSGGNGKSEEQDGNGAGPESNSGDPGPYAVEGGCICKIHYSDKGNATYEPLCNFDAKVTEEILLDDGAEVTHAFIINGRLADGKIFPSSRIPANRFAGMSWVAESWGLRAIVNAGNAKRDALREAIQRLSPETKTRQIFTHTGWREIDGQWIYLSGSMAGNDGYEIDLGTELSRYRLPAVAENPIEAMRASIKLLDVAPLHITAPLFAACFRAPLVSALPQDLSLWLEGITGSMKSTLAALFLCHFGDFDRLHLPGAWSSTANQLERRAFLLKDSLFVIDDYAPAALDHRDLETKASRLLRSQGNISGRGRLRSDLTERPAFPPRGIIISTGEQHPPGQSLLARTLIIEVDGASINMDALTKAQEQCRHLAHAMAGYIGWLAAQMSALPEKLRETFTRTRAKAHRVGDHLRVPEAVAHLWLGLHAGLNYAEEIGAIRETDAKNLQDKCWKAFKDLGQEQAKIVEDEKPTRRFLEVLNTIVTQGKVALLPKDSSDSIDQKPGVDFVGWRDVDFLYLLPQAIFSAVVRFCHDTGEHFPIRQERLKKDLAKQGISECDPGRLTRTAKIGDHTKRILKLNIQEIEALLADKIGDPVTTGHQSHRSWKGEGGVENNGL